jgi:hypothetical protein
MQNWETLIAQRTEAHRESYKPQRIEEPVKRNRSIYEKSPRRKAMHKAWEHSPEGKASRSESYRRYAQSEHGKEVKRRNKRASYLRHKDNPQWHEHKLQLQRAWRARKKAERQKENEAA